MKFYKTTGKYDCRAKAITLILSLTIGIIFLFHPCAVYAAEASVTFGSNWYEKRSGQTFPIGVYIRGDEKVGEYYVELKYDYMRLNYVSGADRVAEEDGVLIMEGSANASELKYRLKFQAISGGEAFIEIIKAEITPAHITDDEIFSVTDMGKAPIYLDGEDTAKLEIDRLEKIKQEEEKKAEELEKEKLAEIQEAEALEKQRLQKLEENQQEETKESEELPIESSTIEIIITETDKSEAYSDTGQEDFLGRNEKAILYIAILFFSMIGILVISITVCIKKKQPDSRYKRTKLEKGTTTDKKEMQAVIEKESELTEEKNIMIHVDNVSMQYKVTTNNVSGLKEYFIQKVKHQISYRTFWALTNIDFDVYQGEIVGIIGTNGSGKSTLLKIISGALKPTGGNVEVDSRKIQLLTLGTGFDMELTARENVYLNGAIIGYTKEFIDEHYESIVEFAELQDFMDEKVKNFSSGMVSRLGFAIATAGDAAEILILDEVLSVGDEFFRKKSLKRIKEMIHSGSTVLMVSHGMGTILENCTKVVWIEKGELKMVGEPKKVCEAYRKMNDKKN